MVAFLAAAAVALTLGAALAEAEGDSTRRLLLIALLGFFVFVAAGGAWAIAWRRGPSDPLVERAQTASHLAHELRNPLMAIRGLASTGVQLFDRMSEDERRDFFRLIDEESARLRRIAEQSATALKVDAEQLSYDLRSDDLGSFIEQVAWATPCGAHPMTVETEPGVTVRLDRTHLAEVVTNLIDNAAKYSPPDAPIDVSVRREGGRAVLDVADHGPGVPAERVDDVFVRFSKWRPGGYEETPGAGLGLFLAQAHVRVHEGTIEILDREGGGSILRVTLPVDA